MEAFEASFVDSKSAGDPLRRRAPLAATTIQGAIDEALAAAPGDFHGADTLVIFADGAEVISVGLGAEGFRT